MYSMILVAYIKTYTKSAYILGICLHIRKPIERHIANSRKVRNVKKTSCFTYKGIFFLFM